MSWDESKYGIWESWDSGACVGLGKLYILAVVVAMIDDSNLKCYKS